MGLADNTIKILIIDDDEDDFFIISEYIKKIPRYNFIVEWSYKYLEAMDHICGSKYDLYFVDYRLGIKTGLELLKEAIENKCEEPIILLTGKGNRQIDEEAMKAGAIDYLIKTELNTEKLERSIRYAIDRAASLKALRQNEKKFRNIFERSKDAVFLADNHFSFFDINDALPELLHFNKNDLIGLRIYDLIAENNDIELLQKELEIHGEIDDKEITLLTKAGEKVECLLSATRETDEKNNSYLQGIIHDISNLKKAERANLQAEKLNAASRLLHMLAHEIRGPLNNINLSVEALSVEKTGEEYATYLDIISRNSNRINDLILQLLNSSRPVQTVLHKIELQELLNETLSIAADRIMLKNINASALYPGKAAIIFGDAEKLKIAFLNIIINAMEAIHHDNGILIISVEESSTSYIVMISDNGSGITDENMKRLFEPYFTSKRNGLGLGLASTLAILQSHKGAVDITTKPGEGTTFSISIPKA
jgi:PAS domain S-box-containing protein